MQGRVTHHKFKSGETMIRGSRAQIIVRDVGQVALMSQPLKRREKMSNDFINNMDDLQAEHEAAKQEAERIRAEQEAKEEEARRKERDEVEAIARAKRNVSRAFVFYQIADFVRDGVSHAVDEVNGKLFIAGVDVTHYLDFVQERTQTSSWRSSPNGKMRLTVGKYGSKTSFPQKKDGSHNYAEIARLLTGIAERKNSEIELERKRNANANAVATLHRELFPNDERGYCDVLRPSSNPEKPIWFNFKIESAMTVDQARALAAALRATGIKLHYSDK